MLSTKSMQAMLRNLKQFEETVDEFYGVGEANKNGITIQNLQDKTVVLVQLAGMKKEDVTVSVVGKDSIMVNAKREPVKYEGFTSGVWEVKKNFYIERDSLDFDSMEASMEDGLLVLAIPLKKSGSKIKKIEIK